MERYLCEVITIVEPAKKIVQAAAIDAIRKKNKVTYTEIAESIGVHRSHIQKVSKCVRPLSEDKFTLLCNIWQIDVTEITKQMELDDMQVLRWKTLKRIIEARKINLAELSESTGISILDLNLIMRGKKELSDEHVRIISGVLDIDAHIIKEGQVAIIFELIRKGLWYIHTEPSAIDAVMSYIEQEI